MGAAARWGPGGATPIGQFSHPPPVAARGERKDRRTDSDSTSQKVLIISVSFFFGFMVCFGALKANPAMLQSGCACPKTWCARREHVPIACASVGPAEAAAEAARRGWLPAETGPAGVAAAVLPSLPWWSVPPAAYRVPVDTFAAGTVRQLVRVIAPFPLVITAARAEADSTEASDLARRGISQPGLLMLMHQVLAGPCAAPIQAPLGPVGATSLPPPPPPLSGPSAAVSQSPWSAPLVVDVGTHYGLAATFAALEGCRVAAMEPMARFRSFASQNVFLNGVQDRVVVIAAAADSGPGPLTVASPVFGCLSCARVYPPGETTPSPTDFVVEACPGATVDNAAATAGAALGADPTGVIPLLRVAVNGHEGPALRSASGLLASGRVTNIILEVGATSEMDSTAQMNLLTWLLGPALPAGAPHRLFHLPWRSVNDTYPGDWGSFPDLEEWTHDDLKAFITSPRRFASSVLLWLTLDKRWSAKLRGTALLTAAGTLQPIEVGFGLEKKAAAAQASAVAGGAPGGGKAGGHGGHSHGGKPDVMAIARANGMRAMAQEQAKQAALAAATAAATAGAAAGNPTAAVATPVPTDPNAAIPVATDPVAQPAPRPAKVAPSLDSATGAPSLAAAQAMFAAKAAKRAASADVDAQVPDAQAAAAPAAEAGEPAPVGHNHGGGATRAGLPGLGGRASGGHDAMAIALANAKRNLTPEQRAAIGERR